MLKMFHTITLLFLFLFSKPLMAEPYIQANGNLFKLYSKEAQTKNTYSGKGIGVGLGYKLFLLSPEVIYENLNAKGSFINSNSQKVTATIKDSLFKLQARVYFFEIFDVLGGLAFHHYKTQLSINGQGASSSITGFQKGIILGAGVRAPMIQFDLFADGNLITAPENTILNLEVGFRYYL